MDPKSNQLFLFQGQPIPKVSQSYIRNFLNNPADQAMQKHNLLSLATSSAWQG